MKYPNGSESILSHGPWMQLIKVKGALCSDGKRRTARITGQADTMWTVPASMKVRGRTVTGFLSVNDGIIDGHKEGYEFHANKSGKNGGLLQ